MTFSPRDIHRIDQASPEAWDDVDDLANDRETSRRLAERGQDTYAAELTRDLHAQAGSDWSLAGFAAMATIRRVQERDERNELRAEIAKLRAGAEKVIDSYILVGKYADGVGDHDVVQTCETVVSRIRRDILGGAS